MYNHEIVKVSVCLFCAKIGQEISFHISCGEEMFARVREFFSLNFWCDQMKHDEANSIEF